MKASYSFFVECPSADYSGYSGFLSTYYIYDEFNQLRFVIQPKAVAALLVTDWQLSGTIINELCFRYEYDERGRMLGKKAPGAGWVYMVYDQRDRVVFTQDANMRTSDQWQATLYDELNRPVTTGMFPYTGNRSDLQIYVSGISTGSSSSVRVIYNSDLQTHLFVNVPVPEPSVLEAKETVVLNPGFTTLRNTPVLVKISDISEKANFATVSGNPLPVPIDSLIVLTNTYYDDYSWSPSATYNDSYITKLDTGSNLHPEPVPGLEEQQKVFTKGLITTTRIRVIEDPANLSAGRFLTNTNFYDDKGRLLQTQNDNYKTGVDTVTSRFDFSGNIISNYLAHSNPVAGIEGVIKVKTSFDYDHGGRLLKAWKTINDDAVGAKLIVNISYDELGRLNKKELGSIDSVAIETLDYTYNIRGWLQSINHDYTSKESNDRWFGEKISYDWGFDSSQYNGNIAGTKWRTKGFDYPLSYGYTYDKANRLMGAWMGLYYSTEIGFAEYPYYHMQMGNGTDAGTAYDENGNIQAMKQWAWQAHSLGIMDNMTYNYSSGSNKLLNVIDSAVDYKLRDFHTSNLHPEYDSKTSTTVDYTYDENGNLLKDLNRDIGTASVSGIQYNHMNLPYKITVNDSAGTKGVITYIYDAVGNRLEKRVTETGHSDINTTYIGSYVYENNKLQFISHEEGRTRYAKKYFVNGDSTYQFVHDYFVKDHLGNIRMVLTEQKDTAGYFATMETSFRAKEDALFSNVTSTAYPDSLVPGGYPVDTSITNPNAYVSRLNASNNKLGPSLVLKVMAGDKVDIGVKSFYRPNGSPGDDIDISEPIIESLYAELLSTLGNTKGFLGEPGNPFGSSLLEGLYQIVAFRDDNNPTTSGKPKAFVNWILFDEHLRMVNTYPQSGAITVGDADVLNTIAQNDIDITRNGYLYVYLSNDTEYWDVFFDNLAVNHRSGPLVEETHYYPFGLTMMGISSKALTSGYIENKKKYNGIEFEGDIGLNFYDAQFRELDPQIGKWWQIDPKIENMEMWSPYASNYNNPIRYSDPLGDEGEACCQGLWDGIKKVGTDFYNTVVYDAKVINTYLNPATPFVEAVVGKSVESNFTEDKSRATALKEAAITLIPGGKIEGAIVKAIDKKALLEANKALGKNFEKSITKSVTEKGEKDIAEQLTIKAENGAKTKVDIASKSSDGAIKLREVKGSQTAPLTKNQKSAHPSIEKMGERLSGKASLGSLLGPKFLRQK